MRLALPCYLLWPAGFAKPATIDEIAKHGHVLTPGRYVGAEDIEEDAEPFAENKRVCQKRPLMLGCRTGLRMLG